MAETREHPIVENKGDSTEPDPSQDVRSTEARAIEHERIPDIVGAAILVLRGNIGKIIAGQRTSLTVLVNGETMELEFEIGDRSAIQFNLDQRRYIVQLEDRVPETRTTIQKTKRSQAINVSADGVVRAPLPGVVSGLLVNMGSKVESEDIVLRLEAMKMQNSISAGSKGVVKQLFVEVGQEVSEGDVLLEIEKQ